LYFLHLFGIELNPWHQAQDIVLLSGI